MVDVQVVRELDKEDLALLIQFVTGTSKVPLDGFKALQVRPLTSALDMLAHFISVTGPLG